MRLRRRRGRRPGRQALSAARRSGASTSARSTALAPFVATYRDPAFLASIDGSRGPATSTTTSRWCRTPSGASPTTRSARSPSTSTATTTTSPRRSSPAWPRSAPFGLSIPEEYGGFAAGGESDYIGMVVATEELSRGSLGVGGSLITRPEILTRALVKGGTEEQKQQWLPRLATGRGHGRRRRHRARLRLRRRRHQGHRHQDRRRLADQRREDLVHVRRPGRRPHAAGPHRPRPVARRHRGLSLFIVPKPRATATASSSPRRRGPTAAPRAAGRWRAARSTRSATAACTPTRSPSTTGSCPTTTSSAAKAGSGKGFYLQMAGFENGRLQTAARAIGVMQAAYEAARQYALDRDGLRPAHRRVPAHPGQAGPHGGDHPGRPPVHLRRGPDDGQGRGRDGGVDGQGLRLQGGRVGDPRGHADPRRLRATPRSTRSAATSSTPGCCRSSRAPTRPCASRSSPAASSSRPRPDPPA